jgi:hypothetical protein
MFYHPLQSSLCELRPDKSLEHTEVTEKHFILLEIDEKKKIS